jgi:hypothetical protein
MLKVSVLIALLFAISHAQIDPATVSERIRETWCNDQTESCPLLCTQIGASTNTASNTCDVETLSFSCVCENGLQPNASEFSQTIPFHLCTEANIQCEKRCPSGDNNCITGCRTARPCGAQNPTRINATSTASGTASSTAASSTASETDSYGGFGGPEDEDDNNSENSSGSGSDSPAAASSSSAANGLFLPTTLAGRGEFLGLGMIFICFSAGFAIFL